MIRIRDIKIPLRYTKEDLQKFAEKELGIGHGEIAKLHIAKRSLDARRNHGAKICYIFTLDVELLKGKTFEEKVLKHCSKNPKIQAFSKKEYALPLHGENGLNHRPVVIGFGPAGIFAALNLAKAGYRPIVIERGESVKERTETVKHYWETGEIKNDSNVSFGEGGAGTFSDGKLNTMVKDSSGRNHEVMSTFVKHGADEEILYDYKPHIGTDLLSLVVEGIREEIKSLGGEIRFNERLEDILLDENKTCKALRIRNLRIDEVYDLDCEVAVLAIGHSARDTFAMLYRLGLPMEAKSFAIGLRVQHPQSLIDVSQFGEDADILSPAPYKLTHTAASGRGVYSFCMCPGGYVVAASTEAGGMVVNGMSYHSRSSKVANSAIIVTVNPKDFREFAEQGVLCGPAFQRMLEERAYKLGNGKIPVQLYGDFKAGKISASYGSFMPAFKGETRFAPLHELFDEEIKSSIIEAMESFHKKIKGFGNEDTVLAGVESRTSSPVKIVRDAYSQSEIRGIYPCGEGAGYAGGITSAAMDGIKVAESIISRFRPMK